MIERLDQLTMSQFVDLVCGNTEVLLEDKEIADPRKIVLATRAIVLEYRSIADPGGTNSYFKHIEDWIKAKINVIIFTMCSNLVLLKQYNRVREVLEAYGLSVDRWPDSRVDGTIQAKLAHAQRELDIIEKERERASSARENIRSQFDTQTAMLMAHFKFQIDPATIKATIYANLVARHNSEIKAKIAAKA